MSDCISCDFAKLPVTIIVQILSKLKFRDQLSAFRVCQTWYKASYDPIISKTISIKIARLIPNNVDIFLRPFDKLKLEYTTIKHFKYKGFLLKYGAQIREIEINYCDLSLKQFLEFLVYLTNLSVLRICVEGKTFSMHDYRETTLIKTKKRIILKNLRYLQEFSVTLDAPENDGLCLIMPHLINLTKLSCGIFDSTDMAVFRNFIDYLGGDCEKITLPELEMVKITPSNTDNFFRNFSKITKKLDVNTLKLGSISPYLYDEHFEQVCRKLRNVKVLTMCELGENQLADICLHMTELEELDLFVNTVKIHKLRKLSSLKKLHIYYTKSYEEAFNEDVLLGLISPNLNNLTDFKVNYPIFANTLVELCKHSPALIKLDLSSLRTRNLFIIYKNLIKLQSLKLVFQCETINAVDDSVGDLNITNLEFLNVLEVTEFVQGLSWELTKLLPNLSSISRRLLLQLKNKIDFVNLLRNPVKQTNADVYSF